VGYKIDDKGRRKGAASRSGFEYPQSGEGNLDQLRETQLSQRKENFRGVQQQPFPSHQSNIGRIEVQSVEDLFNALARFPPGTILEDVTELTEFSTEEAGIRSPQADKAVIKVSGWGVRPGRIYTPRYPTVTNFGKHEVPPPMIEGTAYNNNAGGAVAAGVVENINAVLGRNGRTGFLHNEDPGGGAPIYFQYRENGNQAFGPVLPTAGIRIPPQGVLNLSSFNMFELFIFSLVAGPIAYNLAVH